MNKRQRMERKIYEKAVEEGRKQEYIDQRVAASTMKYQERLAKAAEKRALLKLGRQYIAKNHVPLYVGVLGQYAVTAGALMKTNKDTNTAYYRAAYCLCSPKDTYRLETAEGYIGHRLSLDDDPFAFGIITGGGSIKPFRLMRLIEVHIQMDLLAPRVPGPNKLIQLMSKTQPYFRMVQIKEETDYEKEKPDTVRRCEFRDKGKVPYWNLLLALRAESADVHEKLGVAGRKIPDTPVPFATIP